jgi:hypothetical protein
MPKKPKAQEEEVLRIRDDNFVTVYTNSIGIMQSALDIQLLFSHVQLRPEEKGGKIIVDRAIVAMSPQQAKALTTVLTDTMKQWETAFGGTTTPIPPK